MKTPPASMPPRLELMKLEERKSASGSVYYSGFWGGIRVVMFPDRTFEHDPSRPAVLGRWSVLAEQAPPRPPRSKGGNGGAS